MPLKSSLTLASVVLGSCLMGACQEPDSSPSDGTLGEAAAPDAAALDMDMATLDMDVAGACCQACTGTGGPAVYCHRCAGVGQCDWINPFVIDGETCEGRTGQRLCGCLLTIYTGVDRCDVVDGVVILSSRDFCDFFQDEMVCGWPPGPRPRQ